MNPLFPSLAVLALSVAAAAPVSANSNPPPSNPPPTCDIRANNLICPLDSQVLTFLKSCPRDSGEAYCPDYSEPPPAEIECDSFDNSVICDAWPQSDGITYRYFWSLSTGMSPAYTANEFSPSFFGHCSGRIARVSVTVIAPNGTATSAQATFPCLQDQ